MVRCLLPDTAYSNKNMRQKNQKRWYYSLAKKLMYVKVICSELGPSAVPPYHMLLGVDPLEHVKHDFVIVVVQKPNAGILIIFLEWNCNPSDASENTACKKAMENTLSSRGKP
jgi:hypothetical protein